MSQKKPDLQQIFRHPQCVFVSQVEKLAESNKQFSQFLQDPSVPKKEKMTALEEILAKIKVSETTHSLFGKKAFLTLRCRTPVNYILSDFTGLDLCAAEVLAENNRLNEIPKIVTTFEELVASAKGQVKATITTAQVCLTVSALLCIEFQA